MSYLLNLSHIHLATNFIYFKTTCVSIKFISRYMLEAVSAFKNNISIY